MRILLDTHFLIWAAIDRHRLSAAARAVIKDPEAEILFSVVSIWEIAIKHRLRRSDYPVSPGPLRHVMLKAGYEELPVFSRHAIAVAELAPIHGDPFDRLLVAQSQEDGLTLLTADRVLGGYGPSVRVV